jgi:single-strand DNA-binding protein
MLPKLNFMARLAREPETQYTQSGIAICKVTLASSEKYKERETQCFIDATAFNKTAEFLANVQKGHRVHVAGKLQTEQWEKDGQKRSKISMIIESFEYVESKQQGQQNNGYQQPQNQGYQNQGGYQQQPPRHHEHFGSGTNQPQDGHPFYRGVSYE